MAGKDNLDPIRSKEVARQRQLLSAKKRSQNVKEAKVLAKLIAERMGEEDYETMIRNLIERAKESDKSFEVLRDTLGQKPKEAVQIEQDKPFVIEVEIER